MVRETARRRATRGAALVEYALVLALLVLGVAGSIRYFERETDKEIDNQADCISDRPPPPSCQIPAAVPEDPENPGGSQNPPSGGGTPTVVAAQLSELTVAPQPPSPGGIFDIEITLVLTGEDDQPIVDELVSAQVVVTRATAANRVGQFFYVNCVSDDTGTCTFEFDSRWGGVDEVRVEIVAVGVDTPYQFEPPTAVVVGRPA